MCVYIYIYVHMYTYILVPRERGIVTTCAHLGQTMATCRGRHASVATSNIFQYISEIYRIYLNYSGTLEYSLVPGTLSWRVFPTEAAPPWACRLSSLIIIIIIVIIIIMLCHC